MTNLNITISRNHDDIMLLYNYTDNNSTFKMKHGVSYGIDKKTFPRFITALKNNSKFSFGLDNHDGNTDIGTKDGKTFFSSSRYNGDGDNYSEMSIVIPNQLVLEAFEKLIPQIEQLMVESPGSFYNFGEPVPKPKLIKISKE